LTAAAVAAALLTILGCADDKPTGDLPALHPAKGKVMFGKAPAAGGSVQLKPDPAAPGGADLVITSSVTADGTFELQTLHALSQKKAAGAPAGTYKVTYLPPLSGQQSGGAPVAVPKPVTVAEGPNDLTIDVPGKK